MSDALRIQDADTGPLARLEAYRDALLDISEHERWTAAGMAAIAREALQEKP